MKRFFSFLLSACIAANLSVTAFAAVVDTKTTDITFNVDPTYTVTIPATVELQKDAASGNYKSDAVVSADNVRLLEGNVINVALSGDFKLSTGVTGASYELPYTVKVGNSAATISSGDTVAVFNTDTAQQLATLHFDVQNPTYAGNYTDTVTFTISVINR